ncbi:MAG: hypothetical protein ACLPTJ_10700 [Solirubrobacteraceae bacterium]
MSSRRRVAVALLLLAVGVGACGATTRDPAFERDSRAHRKQSANPASHDCRPPYSADSPWNTPLPRDTRYALDSAQLVGTITGPLTSDPTEYTYPVYTTTVGQPKVPVYIQNAASIMTSPHRLRRTAGRQLWLALPAHAQPASGSDRQLILLDPRNGDEWGFWQLFNSRDPLTSDVPAGSGTASSPLPVLNAYADFYAGGEVVIGEGTPGAEMVRIRYFSDADHMVLARGTRRAHAAGTEVWGVGATNGYQYNTNWSGVLPTGFARGAGVTYLAGLIRPCEIAQGRIDHALAFAYPYTTPQFVYPARKSDGSTPPGDGLPEGSRLQLDPGVSDRVIKRVWGCTNACFTIAKALQRYGMYLVDTGGRPKIVAEDDRTAHWGGKITASTVSPIPVTSLRLVR